MYRYLIAIAMTVFVLGTAARVQAAGQGTAITSLPYDITSEGNYYLPTSLFLDASQAYAISVYADNVTIDLCGNTLASYSPGQPGSANGIVVTQCKNVEIRNGSINNFGSYAIVSSGFTSDKGISVVKMRFKSNQGGGVSLAGAGNVIRECAFIANQGVALNVDGSMVTDCLFYQNQSSVVLGTDCVISGCKIEQGGSVGIFADSRCTIVGNTITSNSGGGVRAHGDNRIANNTIASSTGHGIEVNDRNLVSDNLVSTSTSVNIRIVGSGNSVQGNLITKATGAGLEFYGHQGNYYGGNRFYGNGSDVSNPGANTDGGNTIM